MLLRYRYDTYSKRSLYHICRNNSNNNNIKSKRNCIIYNISSQLTDYETGWRYQRALAEHSYRNKVNNNISIDSMLILQHPSIYTLGKGSTIDNIKFHKNKDNMNHDIVRIERGGEVTWHGPGQLVVYPIFDLNYHKKDLHWFTNSLEQVIIDMLSFYKIQATRLDVNTGVWVNNNKVCAIGVSASRWITYHGLALNVNSDLKYYDNIIPCGISSNEYGVCSIQSCSNNNIDIDSQVTNNFIQSITNVFNLNITELGLEDSKQKLDHIVSLYPDIKTARIQYITK